MKLLSTFIKEMKIASRGFYFYIEIFIAILMLVIILVAINPYPDSKAKEYIFYDVDQVTYDALLLQLESNESVVQIEDTTIELKPTSFEVLNKTTNLVESYDYPNKKEITVTTFQRINETTGKVENTIYLLNSMEDILRVAYNSIQMCIVIHMDSPGEMTFEYITQGYETERYQNLLYMINRAPLASLEEAMNQQIVQEIGLEVGTLNNQESLLPVYIVFAGSLMGFFIIISYLFLDKDQGVIKAFAVTPSQVWKYLLSKTFVIITTVVISTSIIVIPVMGLKPNYLLLYLLLIITTFAFSTLGLLVASFFDNMSKAFGILYLFMIIFMLPGFSYYISSFDPIWIRIFPTYPILQAFKMILLGNVDLTYILLCCLGFLVGGVLLLFLANQKFKKSLTV